MSTSRRSFQTRKVQKLSGRTTQVKPRSLLSTKVTPQRTVVAVKRRTQGKRRGAKRTRGIRAGMPRLWTNAVSKPDMGILFRPIWLGTISGAAASIVKRFIPNSIWQPEASGGTGTTPGYADWAAFYGFYRVIHYKYRVTFTNKENFDVSCWISNSSNDPGTTTNSTITSNPFTQWKTLSAKGGLDRVTLSGSHLVSTIAGTDTVLTDDSFRSLIGANPADVMWIGIGLQSFGGNLTNGVDIECQISQKTIMYDYLLQTPSDLQQIKKHRKELAAKQETMPPPSMPTITMGQQTDFQ